MKRNEEKVRVVKEEAIKKKGFTMMTLRSINKFFFTVCGPLV
jgi:hypothetical protein